MHVPIITTSINQSSIIGTYFLATDAYFYLAKGIILKPNVEVTGRRATLGYVLPPFNGTQTRPIFHHRP
jgi:hypothetical protein